ncbi:type I restriction endonuclease [Arcanobacterium haemolyticum]
MPFISTVLGYDVFNPSEVIPEFTADVGVKKGEKVDYAIRTGGEIQILIECKKTAAQLSVEHASQLYRYFSVTNAHIAILTNGRVYNFYTDLESPNKMDSKPFLILDLADIDDAIVPELRKLTKVKFDLTSILSSAEELKYVGAMKRELASEFKDPSSDFVKLLTSRVFDGRFTQSVQEKFTSLVSIATTQFLSEKVNDRLKAALGTTAIGISAENDSSQEAENSDGNDNATSNDGIETTESELLAYSIIKAIVCSDVTPDRVV